MKKIMFNDRFGLTQAVLDGRKTQTRRIMKGKPLLPTDEIESAGILGDEVQIIANGGESLITMKLPYKHDEVVAVAQSYKAVFEEQQDDTLEMLDLALSAGWNNKMFVRANLMPHKIRITNVRIERLQDISDEDCLKEGLEWDGMASKYYINYQKETGRKMFLGKTLREAFACLIDKVSGKGTWERNTYVFVYDFELVKQK